MELRAIMIAKAFIETMSNDFYVQNEVRHIFSVKPTFAKYTEVDEICLRVTKLTIPDERRWEELVNLLDLRIIPRQ